MSTRARRLPPAESRAEALEAARDILVNQGAQAITLQAVADKMGRTPGNLLHHFGSAGELQKALGVYLTQIVTSDILAAFAQVRLGELDPRKIVDMSFDAFAREGGGALAGWMLLTGEGDALIPVIEVIAAVAKELVAMEPERSEIPQQILVITLLALGNSMFGEALAEGLGLARDAPRQSAHQILIGSLAYYESEEVRAAVSRWIESRTGQRKHGAE